MKKSLILFHATWFSLLPCYKIYICACVFFKILFQLLTHFVVALLSFLCKPHLLFASIFIWTDIHIADYIVADYSCWFCIKKMELHSHSSHSTKISTDKCVLLTILVSFLVFFSVSLVHSLFYLNGLNIIFCHHPYVNPYSI